MIGVGFAFDLYINCFYNYNPSRMTDNNFTKYNLNEGVSFSIAEQTL